MPSWLFLKLAVVALVLPFLGVGCTRENWRNFLQTRLKAAPERALNVIGNSGRNLIKNLTVEQKRTIEEWLKKNKLNKYGDGQDTVYSGGTPFFNEATGETVNRYDYLFKKFPELKEVVKKALWSPETTEVKK